MAKRFAVMIVVVIVGVLIGGATGHVGDLLNGPFYAPLITTLLAIGLYGSTHAIERDEVRGDLRTIILAVTVGVLAKAALITAVMLLAFHRSAYLVLGVAVAQIDPLSVVALGRSSRLSARSRGLLLAWASFDDPVTTLLTIYVAGLALSLRPAGSAGSLDLGGPGGFVLDLLGNLLVAGAVAVLHRLARRLRPWPRFAVDCVLLAAVLAIGVWQTWVLAVALAGLVVRPLVPGRMGLVRKVLDRAVDGAFVLATLLLGLILSLGVNPLAGLVLGVTAFGVHALVSLPLTRRQTRADRVHLALAQQNGVTAIILALLLEPAFGGTVAIVAPAILVINALYLTGNGLYGLSGTRLIRLVLGRLAGTERARRIARSAPRPAPREKPFDFHPEIGDPRRNVLGDLPDADR